MMMTLQMMPVTTKTVWPVSLGSWLLLLGGPPSSLQPQPDLQHAFLSAAGSHCLPEAQTCMVAVCAAPK